MVKLTMFIVFYTGVGVSFNVDGLSNMQACEVKAMRILHDIKAKGMPVYTSKHSCTKIVNT